MAACATCGYYPAVYFNVCPAGECRICGNWRRRHNGEQRPADAIAAHADRTLEQHYERLANGLPPAEHNKTWRAEPTRRNRRRAS